jgi:hypothetical protein
LRRLGIILEQGDARPLPHRRGGAR